MRFISIDLETTGLAVGWNQMCEFGWATDESSGGFFVPVTAWHCDPEAMQINGYWERIKNPTADRLSHLEAIKAIYMLLDPPMSEEETCVVCSPSFFDIGFLADYWRTHVNEVPEFSKRPPWGHRNVIDIKSMAAGLGFNWAAKNSEIGEAVGIEDTSNHTAEQDAKYQLEIFNELKIRRDGGQ